MNRQIGVTVSEEVHAVLVERAQRERRSVSNLAGFLLDSVLLPGSFHVEPGPSELAMKVVRDEPKRDRASRPKAKWSEMHVWEKTQICRYCGTAKTEDNLDEKCPERKGTE